MRCHSTAPPAAAGHHHDHRLADFQTAHSCRPLTAASPREQVRRADCGGPGRVQCDCVQPARRVGRLCVRLDRRVGLRRLGPGKTGTAGLAARAGVSSLPPTPSLSSAVLCPRLRCSSLTVTILRASARRQAGLGLGEQQCLPAQGCRGQPVRQPAVQAVRPPDQASTGATVGAEPVISRRRVLG